MYPGLGQVDELQLYNWLGTKPELLRKQLEDPASPKYLELLEKSKERQAKLEQWEEDMRKWEAYKPV